MYLWVVIEKLILTLIRTEVEVEGGSCLHVEGNAIR